MGRDQGGGFDEVVSLLSISHVNMVTPLRSMDGVCVKRR